MTILDAMIAGDVYIDYPFEEAKFRYDKKAGKVFRKFYGESEVEIELSSSLFKEAISGGKLISKEEYYKE